MELERFFPALQSVFSGWFFSDYYGQTEVIREPGSKFKLKDVLSKENIWSSLEKRGEGGDQGTLEKIAENQWQLRNVVSQLMNETSELKEMITKLDEKWKVQERKPISFLGVKLPFYK